MNSTRVDIDKLETICANALRFLELHSVNGGGQDGSWNGSFSLYREARQADLYGMIDAVYILYAMGKLSVMTDREARRYWADQILGCQDAEGWFTRRNLRGHSREHATAYAVGALKLLAIEPDEDYLDRLVPIRSLLPLLVDREEFLNWIRHLQFDGTLRDILRKNVGWHHIWRGSHIGGGIPAIFEMTRHMFTSWWSEDIDDGRWFGWYFEWLDDHASAETGFWQRAFWNKVYRRPTIIDMGGAVHFFWIYEAFGRDFPFPEGVIRSTISLQKRNGLYRDHPYCIDLDGNFCVIRSYLQLDGETKERFSDDVHRSAEANFCAVVEALTAEPLEAIYEDSHGLPGALAALVECAKLPGFRYTDLLEGWQHPMDRVCWI